MSEPISQRLTYRSFWALRALAVRLPERLGVALFGAVAGLAFRVMPATRAVVAANQAQALGREQDDPAVVAATREAFVRYGRYWYEGFHAVELSQADVLRRFRCEGKQHMDAALEDGKGVILALPHMGNWDVAGKWVHSLGLPIVSVAERLEPERLFKLFEDHRRSLGMDILPLDTGTGTGRALAQALAENNVVALVADRDLAGTGIEVEMFGRTRRMPAGPAALALRTGAALVPCGIYTEQDGWLCVMRGPIRVAATGNRRGDVTELTRRLAAEFVALISADPSDWHMFQPGWP
ncbi:MAG: phosphatidylinositol mannoside acyltransferase [Actinomycetota bacterium]